MLLDNYNAAGDNWIAECHTASYQKYNHNFALELQIVNDNCVQSTTNTSAICSIYFKSFSDGISSASIAFDNAVNKLYSDEHGYYGLDINAQSIITNDPVCQNLFNQIQTRGPIHTIFVACVSAAQSLKLAAMMAIQQKFNSAIANCDPNVS